MLVLPAAQWKRHYQHSGKLNKHKRKQKKTKTNKFNIQNFVKSKRIKTTFKLV